MSEPNLSGLIGEILQSNGRAMTPKEIKQELEENYDLEYTERNIQSILADKFENGILERERRKKGSPGRPPYHYYYPTPPEDSQTEKEKPPESSAIADEDEFETLGLQGRGDVDPSEVDSGEHRRLPEGVYWDIVEEQLEMSDDVQRLYRVAPDIAEENPAELIANMAEWTIDRLNEIGEELWVLHNKGQTGALRRLRDDYDELAGWADQYFERIWQFGTFDDPGPDVIRIPDSRDFVRAKDKKEITEISAQVNRDAALSALSERVFGKEFIKRISIEEEITDTVGTDSSVAKIQLSNRSALTPEATFEIFAGAAALLHNNRRFTDFDFTPHDLKEYRHRRAFRRGLIISRATGRLTQDEMRMARFAAMDLRQYKEAVRVVDDDVDWRPHGDPDDELIDYTGPDVMFLDGRLTPLVHQQSEFKKDSLYGELTRREIREFAKLTDYASEGSWETDTTFAGVVKRPGISWLAPLVFWYMETQWDDPEAESEDDNEEDIYLSGTIRNVTQPPVSDVVLPHLLFRGLSDANGVPKEEAFMTFRVLRRFYDNSIPRRNIPPVDETGKPIDTESVSEWMDHFEYSQEATREYGGETIDLEKYKRFGFANACANAGQLMCYAGPPNLYQGHQGKPLRLPRIEVLANPPNDAPEKIKKAVAAFAQQTVSDEAHTVDDLSTNEEVPVVVPRAIVESDKIAKYARDSISDDITSQIQEAVRQLR